MKTNLRAALAVMWMVLFTIMGPEAAAQVRYLSKSGIREVAAQEAHFFEVTEENASGEESEPATIWLTAQRQACTLTVI
jgi:hypothetical protein